MQCPFVYANGRRCTGQIHRARAYGRNHGGGVREHDVRKIRLWCSEKDDHAGVVPSFAGKNRMEFYPDQLERFGLYAEALALCDNVAPGPAPRDTAAACAMASQPASIDVSTDPVLTRFRQALTRLYGDRLDRVVLFGSRARGDAHPQSDYDIAVFLKDFHDRWGEMDRILPVVTDILYDAGAFIHAMPYRAGADRERTPLMHEIRHEGVDL